MDQDQVWTTSPWQDIPRRETVGDSSLVNKRIIAIAVDASDNSVRAVRWAMNHVIDSDRDVVMLMNVRPTMNLYTPALTDLLDHRSVEAMDLHERKESHKIINKFMDWMHSMPVACRGFSLCGDHVGHEIALEVKHLKADMLIMGTRGMGGLKRLFLGSVSEHCLHHIDYDPYIQGRITCANVLSDLYAMGVTECDNMLMLLGISTEIEPELKETVSQLIMKGFHDAAQEAETSVTGGQTVKSDWFMMGGVATSVVHSRDVVKMNQAQVGHVLVLTKPLGTQVAVNAHTWLKTEKYKRIEPLVSREAVETLYQRAVSSMAQLNRQAAKLLKEYDVKACTDVTGFGILGHAQALNQLQQESVDFVFDLLPCITHTFLINSCVDYGLDRGTSAETSGGLLAVLPLDQAQSFIEKYSLQGSSAWIVGHVVPGSKAARVHEACQLKDV